MKALVTGATGLIGKHLVHRLDHPRVLVRDPVGARISLEAVTAFAWDSNRTVPAEALRDVEVVFHLAGEPVAGGRLNAERKARIRDSRVLGTRRLVEALGDSKERPRVLVSASAIGYYGSRGDEQLTENSTAGSDFLAEVCKEWEKEASAARDLGLRVVFARMGIVLAREGGALAAMRPAFQLGLGGPLGSGRQWMSWIHIDDVVGLLLHAAEGHHVEGPLNVCAPAAVTNADFSRALGRAMHRPAWLRAPAAALRIALGDMADVVLASQRVDPEKARATGYAFRFGTLEATLADLFSTRAA